MPGEPAYSARWSVMTGANPTFSGVSVRHPYTGDTLTAKRKILKSPQMRGTRATVQAQTQFGVTDVSGDLNASASPALLGFHLVQAMGGGTATAPAFADLLPTWAVLADRGTGGYATGDCYKYLGLKTNRLELSARAAGLVDLKISVLGKQQVAGQTFAGAALANTVAEEPFTASQMALDIDGDTWAVTDWNLIIDNGLTARFANSDTCDEVIEGERSVMFTANLPVQTSMLASLYQVVKAGLTGTLSLTNATVSTVFTFNALQFNPETISVQGPEFILPLKCEIRGTSGVEMTVSNDITP